MRTHRSMPFLRISMSCSSVMNSPDTCVFSLLEMTSPAHYSSCQYLHSYEAHGMAHLSKFS